MTPRLVDDRRRWNEALLRLPAPHVLQSWEWGAVKAQTGWSAQRLVWLEEEQPAAAASFLLRRLAGLPWGVAYAPKGPLLDWSRQALAEQVLADLEAHARRHRALFVKIDPDVDLDGRRGQAVLDLLARRGWRPSAEQIQFRNTALLDLAQDEEALLAAMKPKGRYNVRLASRRGVQVRQGGLADLPAFYALYAETGQRDGFIVRPFGYYEQTWRTFMQPADERAPAAHLLLAAVEGDVVAGLMLFRFGQTAWYMVGASSERQRQAMPNHLLQWEAMRLARSCGCTVYDLWGAPDVLEEADPMWGVWRFKESLGAAFVRHIGAWDFPVTRLGYWAYCAAMPRILQLMRRRRHLAGAGAGIVSESSPSST